jgi:hypothetical protein
MMIQDGYTQIYSGFAGVSRRCLDNVYTWLINRYNVSNPAQYEHFNAFVETVQKTESRPTKAICKFFHDVFNVDINSYDKATAGTYIRKNSLMGSYKFVFTYGCAGNAADYYHSNSCWFHEYPTSRDMLEGNGGGAIRAYTVDTNDITGRVWFLPHDDGLVLFNSYGQGDLQHTQTWGAVVAHLLDTLTCEAKLNIDSPYMIYINGSKAAYVGPKVVNDTKQIDVTLKTPTVFHYTPVQYCHDCNRVLVRGGERVYISMADYYVCDKCVDRYTYVQNRVGMYPSHMCVRVYVHGAFIGNYLCTEPGIVYDEKMGYYTFRERM